MIMVGLCLSLSLLQVLFSTETFAMGVNAPARTVGVIDHHGL